MPYTLHVGNVRCHILNDGLHAVDGGGFFGVVPRILWQRVIQPNADNMIPSDTRSLLIESDAGLILVDTGNGDKLTAKERQRLGFGGRTDRLVHDLGKVGYRPEDVDLVILTHLHGDHVGGATRWDSEDHTPGRVVATFPKARYLAQRIDLAEASFPNERTLATYHAENWQPLIDSQQLQIVDGPQRIDANVFTDIAPGHTAALQMVWVENKQENLLFLGDACNWAVHMNRLAWVPAFDIFPITSIETKRRIRQQAFERNTLLVFQHDAQVVTGRMVEGARGPEVRPEITEIAWEDSTL
jgi:glyoxylase-like metal-dependent hydrolase (beta-lactamase superfamily II)